MQVKMSVFLTYIKSVGFFTSFLLIFLYLCAEAAAILSNFWLGDWSSEVEVVHRDPTLNGTKAAEETEGFGNRKFGRLAVYGTLGMGQGREHCSW